MRLSRRWAPEVAALAAVAPLVAGAPASAYYGGPEATSVLKWVAPGGRVVVRGRAEPGEVVGLVVGTRTIAVDTTGPRGRFVLAGSAPKVGRYRFALTARGGAVAIGRLRVRPLVLAAVGDVNLGDGVGTAISAHGTRFPWLSVHGVLRRADLALANLECAISTRGSAVPGKEFTFRGKPASLRTAARYAGLDVVSVANNHALDFGRLAFHDTLANARRDGISPFGGGRNLAAARRPAIRRVGGLRIAFLGYSDVRPPGFDAGPSRSGTAPAFPGLIAADVRSARQTADVVVVYFHWGIERTFSPTARQRSLARVAFDAGAEVVIGAHPHVQQPIRRTRRRLVAWSLGNFVFGATTPGTERTGILRIRLGRRGVLGYSFRRARIVAYQPRLLR